MTEKELRRNIPGGTPIILDNHIPQISEVEVLRSARNYARHRGFLTDLKKILDREPQPSMEEIISLVNVSFGVEKPFAYINEKNDCENASIGMIDWFSGRGVGWAILEGHSLNCFINENGKFKFLESQTAEIVNDNRRLKLTVWA